MAKALAPNDSLSSVDGKRMDGWVAMAFIPPWMAKALALNDSPSSPFLVCTTLTVGSALNLPPLKGDR
eukprot:scaffold140421_cov10-Tisochrysis_lutea.AAC.1